MANAFSYTSMRGRVTKVTKVTNGFKFSRHVRNGGITPVIKRAVRAVDNRSGASRLANNCTYAAGQQRIQTP